MLAGYPAKSLKCEGFRMLSIYGTNDGNVEMLQKGDGTATVESQKQWEEAAEAIDAFLGE